MTREETAMLLSHIYRAYPNNFKVDDKRGTVDTWHFLLAEYDFKDIVLAFKTYIATSGSAFPPGVSELIAYTHKGDELTMLSEAEAWALVSKAVRRANYYADEEFAKLPEIVQKTIGGPGALRDWAQTNEDDFNTVVASNFQRSYRAVTARENTIAHLPAEAKEKLKLAQNIALGIEAKND